MMAKVTRAPDAESDLFNIWEYIAQGSRNPLVADQVLDHIDEKCLLYATRPEAATLRPELAHNVHSFTVYNFVVFHRPTAEGFEVLRVIHGARDVDTEFRRRFRPNG